MVSFILKFLYEAFHSYSEGGGGGNPSGSNIFPIACNRNLLEVLLAEMNSSSPLVSNVRQSSRICLALLNTFVLFVPKLTDLSTGYVSKPFAAHCCIDTTEIVSLLIHFLIFIPASFMMFLA
ncbi:hypothetical protein NPIL_629581 [Nephila pilipes]|uniref:Uncharacterized protein n=1 Tax=Nephila pilipes TaxID=299642 RepID=A0A8X6UKL6_NEPPI|nr:hypothetical protein NPIL_629581 [Nephila pilipes]